MKLYAAIVLTSIVALAPGLPGPSSGGSCPKKGRVWVIAIGDDYGTLNYIDESDGSATGWGKDVIQAACAAAGIHCRIVYAPFSICFTEENPDAHVQLGPGLEIGAYDACNTFFPTKIRRDVAIFSEGFVSEVRYQLWSLEQLRVNRQDLKIVYTTGPGDAYCLRRFLSRSGVTLRDFNDQVGYEAKNSDAFNGLENPYHLIFQNVRDAVISGGPVASRVTPYDINNDGSPMNDWISCTEGPAGLVASVRNWELIDAFNYGLRVIKDNGVYEQICNDENWDQSEERSAFHTTWCVDPAS